MRVDFAIALGEGSSAKLRMQCRDLDLKRFKEMLCSVGTVAELTQGEMAKQEEDGVFKRYVLSRRRERGWMFMFEEGMVYMESQVRAKTREASASLTKSEICCPV